LLLGGVVILSATIPMNTKKIQSEVSGCEPLISIFVIFVYRNQIMASADHIRNDIISRLLTINNKEYLSALFKLVESSTTSQDVLSLSEEQKLMLEMSEEDLKSGRIISQTDLDKEDLKWLKSQ
jgi:hypothetical protein